MVSPSNAQKSTADFPNVKTLVFFDLVTSNQLTGNCRPTIAPLSNFKISL